MLVSDGRVPLGVVTLDDVLHAVVGERATAVRSADRFWVLSHRFADSRGVGLSTRRRLIRTITACLTIGVSSRRRMAAALVLGAGVLGAVTSPSRRPAPQTGPLPAFASAPAAQRRRAARQRHLLRARRARHGRRRANAGLRALHVRRRRRQADHRHAGAPRTAPAGPERRRAQPRTAGPGPGRGRTRSAAPLPRERECPRAILEGLRDDALNPGTRPMRYGASIRMTTPTSPTARTCCRRAIRSAGSASSSCRSTTGRAIPAA